jgi:hypothetical protein
MSGVCIYTGGGIGIPSVTGTSSSNRAKSTNDGDLGRRKPNDDKGTSRKNEVDENDESGSEGENRRGDDMDSQPVPTITSAYDVDGCNASAVQEAAEQEERSTFFFIYVPLFCTPIDLCIFYQKLFCEQRLKQSTI